MGTLRLFTMGCYRLLGDCGRDMETLRLPMFSYAGRGGGGGGTHTKPAYLPCHHLLTSCDSTHLALQLSEGGGEGGGGTVSGTKRGAHVCACMHACPCMCMHV